MIVESFNKMTQSDKQKLYEQEVMMDVDRENEGRWLIPDSDDPSHIRWQRVMEAQDSRGGVTMVRRVVDEMSGSPDDVMAELSGVYPYQGTLQRDWTSRNGSSFNTLPPGVREYDEEDYNPKQNLLQDRKADHTGEMYSYTNPSRDGEAAHAYREVNNGLEPYDDHYQDSNRDERRAGRPANIDDGYGTAQATNIVRDFEEFPYQKESIKHEKAGESRLANEIQDIGADPRFNQSQLQQADANPYNVAKVNKLDTLENRVPPDVYDDEIGDSYATDRKYEGIPKMPVASKTVTAPAEEAEDPDAMDAAIRGAKTWVEQQPSSIEDANAGQYVGMDTAATNLPSALVKRGRSNSMQFVGADYGDVQPKKPRTGGV